MTNSGAASVPGLDVDQALNWIRLLHRDTGGYVGVNSAGLPDETRPDWAGGFHDLTDPGADDAIAEYLDARDTFGSTGIYLGQVSVLDRPRAGGRTKVANAYKLASLWADGDTASPAHKHITCPGGKDCEHPDDPHRVVRYPLPADAAAMWAVVEEAGYGPPSATQDTGNGVYGHWLLNEPQVCTGGKAGPQGQLSDRLHQQLKHAAARLKLHYGPLGDLARVLRLPGTLNRKPGTPGGVAMSRLTSVTDRRYTWGEMVAMVEAAEARTERATPRPVPVTAAPSSRGQGAPTGPVATVDRPRLVQESSPIDDFNRRADWLTDIMEPAGWQLAMRIGQELRITRPGKDVTAGWSATINGTGADTLHVFSSDAAPFEPDENYTKAGAWRELHHGGADGDPTWSATNRDLRARGYGDPLPARPAPAVSLDPPGDDMWAAFNARPPADLEVHDGGEEVFWSSRPILAHIRAVALGQYAAPWATLGVVLAKVVAATMPVVQLPATVGGYGSLNLFVALVAKSGGGKGAAENAAKRCLDLDGQKRFVTHALGSGEGLAHMFMKRPKPTKEEPDPPPVQYNVTALVTVAEIDTLTALSGRQGSTLGGQLRQAAMGEQLGFFYVDREKRMPVPEHAYRLSLVAGVQPKRAAALLDESGGGTPQRFLWLPATTRLPDVIPETPEPFAWRPPDWPVAQVVHGMARTVMPLPQVAIDRTIELRRAHIQGEGDPLDGHANMVRLKVAAALAILDGRTAVDDEDWKLSETLMAVSARTRRGIVEELAADKREANAGQAEAEAARTIIIGDRVEQKARARVSDGIKRRLGKLDEGAWLSAADLRKSLASGIRDHFDPVIEAMITDGSVEAEEVEHRGQQGYQFRLRR